MLNKLIKIDLRSVLKFAPIFFGAGLFFALVSLLFSKFGNSTINEVISRISQNFALSLTISGIVNVITRAIGVFWKRLYGDESYLTHTLPISKQTIYLSKALTLVYSFLITVFASIIILAINYNLFENFDALKNFIEATAGITGGNVVEFLVLVILTGFSQIMTLASTIFLAIIVKNRTKKVAAAIASVSGYFITQGIFLLVLFLLGFINPEIMDLFKDSSLVSAVAMKTVFYTGIIIYIIATIIINQINIKLLEKGVNVA